MATIDESVIVSSHDADKAASLLEDLCDVYAEAYGQVPGEDATAKVVAFRDRASRALTARNYGLVTAHAVGQLVGFAFGYGLRADRGWWDGLTPEPPDGFTVETGERTVVLAEIEVRRAWQGKGVGRAVHDAFLLSRSEERATLASNPAAAATHALYEKWGWRRVGVVPGKPGSYYREYVRFVRVLPKSAAPR